jgi:hypothetical protein
MNDPTRPGRSLTRRQFDEVIRRASELALRDMDGDDGEAMSEADVYRIAREVGLSEAHVRKALTEVDTGLGGAALAQPTTWWDRFWGSETIRVTRVVPGSAGSVARKIDEYMVGGRLLQPVRRSPSFLQYRPAVDWMSQVARAASGTARRYYVASAKSVEVDLEPVDEHRTHVGLSVDAGVRGNYVSGGLIGGISAGGAAGVGAFMGITTAGMGIPLAVAAVALALGLGVAGVSKVAANSHRSKVLEVQAELEGALDMLEAGGQPEPPPPAWRKWIERRFHGARRLLETEDPSLIDFEMDDDEP